MQKIWLDNFQIHDNSQDIGFVVYTPIDGLEWPGVRINPYQKPGEHGAIVPNQFYDGRTITLNGRVAARTPAQYNLNRRSLMNALRIVQNAYNIAQPIKLSFLTMDGLRLYCYCFVSQPPKVPETSLEHATFMIQLYAPDPNIYDTSTQIFPISPPVGGGLLYPATYPVTYLPQTGGSIPLTNAGDNNTFPVVTFYGPLSSPYLKNLTLGETFQVNYSLGPTDTLVVDMAQKTMVLNGNQNAMQYFNYLNTWLSLQPGQNILSLGSGLSSDTGVATVAFQSAFIGV